MEKTKLLAWKRKLVCIFPPQPHKHSFGVPSLEVFLEVTKEAVVRKEPMSWVRRVFGCFTTTFGDLHNNLLVRSRIVLKKQDSFKSYPLSLVDSCHLSSSGSAAYCFCVMVGLCQEVYKQNSISVPKTYAGTLLYHFRVMHSFGPGAPQCLH
jgi:hypothetical protein